MIIDPFVKTYNPAKTVMKNTRIDKAYTRHFKHTLHDMLTKDSVESVNKFEQKI